MIFSICNSNKYQEVRYMQKINIGLLGLLVIILLIVYQNYTIMQFNDELQSSIDNLNVMIEDIHNDVHELIE